MSCNVINPNDPNYLWSFMNGLSSSFDGPKINPLYINSPNGAICTKTSGKQFCGNPTQFSQYLGYPSVLAVACDSSGNCFVGQDGNSAMNSCATGLNSGPASTGSVMINNGSKCGHKH